MRRLHLETATALSLSRRFPSLLALSCSLGISSVLKFFSFIRSVTKCCTAMGRLTEVSLRCNCVSSRSMGQVRKLYAEVGVTSQPGRRWEKSEALAGSWGSFCE